MKNFKTVFKYEFKRQVNNKAFIITATLFIIAAAIGGFFLSSKVNELEDVMLGNSPIVDVESELIYVYAEEQYHEFINQLESGDLAGVYTIEYVDSIEKLEQLVVEEEVVGLIVNDLSNIKKVVGSVLLTGDIGSLDSVLNGLYQTHLLVESGLTAEQVMQIQSSTLNIETINVGSDSEVGFGIVFAYNFILYMAIILFGGIISSSVITEKTSKAMELLITSAKSRDLIAGKVFAVGLSCILLMVTVISSLLISIKLFMSETALDMLLSLIGGVPYDVLLFGLFLFIVGFFSVLFLFAGLSSFGTKPEDANTIITPLILLIVAVFMINMGAIGTNLLEQPLFVFLSYVPILSPFLLFTRYVIYNLSTIEIIAGIVVNIIGAYGLILLAAKIYRAGTLHYGNSISFMRMFKSIRK